MKAHRFVTLLSLGLLGLLLLPQAFALTFKSGESLSKSNTGNISQNSETIDLTNADPELVEAQLLLQRFGYVENGPTGKWSRDHNKGLKRFYQKDLNQSYTGGYSQNALADLRRRRLITMPQQGPITFAQESYDVSHLKVKDFFADKLDKTRYKIHQFGFTAVTSNEISPPFCYPTPQDCTDNPQVFSPNPHNAVAGDFNGDGLEDVAISWIYFTHTMPRTETPSHIRYYLNDGKGNLISSPEVYEDGVIPLRHMLYRMEVKDFNGDGVDDLFSGSMGVIKRVKNVGMISDFEPYTLLLSNGKGGVFDASNQIQGQENGGLIRSGGFAHDASSGDVNCDGYPDIYAGRMLLLNDGKGFFTNATHQLPGMLGLSTPVPKGTAVIEDFNKDGCGDIVTFDFDGTGHLWLSIGGEHKNRKLKKIYYNHKYGKKNTMVNHGVAGDIDGDDIPELVIMLHRKDPYYLGRNVAILKFENDDFVDVTTQHIDDKRDVDGQKYLQSHGEGTVKLRDHDNDGDLDILDTTGASYEKKGRFGYTIFENDGAGNFQQIPQSEFVYLNEMMVSGWNSNRTTIGLGYPVNIDNEGALDYITFTMTPWAKDSATWIGYTVLGK